MLIHSCLFSHCSGDGWAQFLGWIIPCRLSKLCCYLERPNPPSRNDVKVKIADYLSLVQFGLLRKGLDFLNPSGFGQFLDRSDINFLSEKFRPDRITSFHWNCVFFYWYSVADWIFYFCDWQRNELWKCRIDGYSNFVPQSRKPDICRTNNNSSTWKMDKYYKYFRFNH